MVIPFKKDRKYYPKQIGLFKVLEEIVPQYLRDALQQISAERMFAENFENVIGRAGNLSRQPRRRASLLL